MFTSGAISVGTNVYTNSISDLATFDTFTFQPNGTNSYRFFTVSAGSPPDVGVQALGTAGTKLTLGLVSGSVGDSGQRTRVEGQVTINIGTASLILETEPLNADLDIYYENDEVFDITGGFHQSGSKTGDQNQTGSQVAIVNLGFFDCFAFGNGVESYKYLDELDNFVKLLAKRPPVQDSATEIVNFF